MSTPSSILNALKTLTGKTVRGIRDSIPQGYILGRAGSGNGPVELISIDSLSKGLQNSGLGGTTRFANPTATAADTAVNGSAATAMRSDAAPAVQKASSTAFGIVKVDGTTITASGGVISGGPTGGIANGPKIYNNAPLGTPAAVSANYISVEPVLIPAGQKIDTVGFLPTVTAASASWVVGLYNDDGTGNPGTLFSQSTTQTGWTAGVHAEAKLANTYTAASEVLVWVAIWVDTGPTAYATLGVRIFLSSSSSTLVSPFSGGTATTGGPAIYAYYSVGGSATGLTLASGDIFVGNASNVATDVAMSGDATISNTGAVTVRKFNGGTAFGSAAGYAATAFDAAGAAAALGTTFDANQVVAGNLTPVGGAISLVHANGDPVVKLNCTGGNITSFGTPVANVFRLLQIVSADGSQIVNNANINISGGASITPQVGDSFWVLGTASVWVLYNSFVVGDLALSKLGAQTAATALMGPVSGPAANPTFRVLATTDIPALPYTSPAQVAALATMRL